MDCEMLVYGSLAPYYEGSDRPKKRFQKWLSGLSAFWEEFEDSSGQARVRPKAAELLDREAGVQDESREPDGGTRGPPPRGSIARAGGLGQRDDEGECGSLQHEQ